MYLWKVDKLVDDLKEDKVSQRDEVLYIAYFILIGSFVNPSEIYSKMYVYKFIGFVIFFIGIIYCYRVNKKGDNKNFIMRFVSLSIPIFFHMVFVVLFFLLLERFVSEFVYNYELLNNQYYQSVINSNGFTFIISSTLICIYFWYFSIKIKKVSNYSNSISNC